jgi:hypothetical protein
VFFLGGSVIWVYPWPRKRPWRVGKLEDASLAFYFECLVGGLKVNVTIGKKALFFEEGKLAVSIFAGRVDFLLLIKKVEK